MGENLLCIEAAVMPRDILSGKKSKVQKGIYSMPSFCIKKKEIRKCTDICLLLQK